MSAYTAKRAQAEARRYRAQAEQDRQIEVGTGERDDALAATLEVYASQEALLTECREVLVGLASSGAVVYEDRAAVVRMLARLEAK